MSKEEFLDEQSATVFADTLVDAEINKQEMSLLEDTDKSVAVDDGPQPPHQVVFWNDDSGEVIIL